MNKKERNESAVLRCTACGNLCPADIRKECEDCIGNYAFENKGGLPAVLLTGSHDNIANAVSKKGILFGEVVVVAAEQFKAMCEVLDQINRLGDGIEGIVRLKRIQIEALEALKSAEVAG